MNSEFQNRSLLRTKFYRPPIPVDHVPRSELLERLDKYIDRPIVLVSAPAGYGKSTLASFWLEQSKKPGAWLSLDESDDDLHPFLTYFIASLQTLFPDAVRETMALLHARDLPPTTVLATTLVNEIEKIDHRFIVVLDDIHRIKKRAVHDFLDLMLRHPPQSMQLVLIGRRDPLLSISSLRARGILTELRMRDLRFTKDETAQFLQAAAGDVVGEEITSALAHKTEGWVTGLRLAILATRGQENPGRKIMELKGNTRYVVDYLVSEVLDHQPESLARFLLAISILDRFCAPLCDALRGEDPVLAEAGMDGWELINWLQANNLFVIPLDTENQWFRYHHLFAELLILQLKRNSNAEQIARLHCRASRWFEKEGLIDEAIRHALEGGDPVGAADIVGRRRDAVLDSDQWYVLEKWLAMLPAEVWQQRPDLLLAEAWSAYERFQFDRLAAIMEKVAAVFDGQTLPAALSGERFLLLGEIDYWSGKGSSSRAYFEKARAQLPQSRGLVRGLLELQYSLALCMEGERDQAISVLRGRIREAGSSAGIYLSRIVAGLFFIHHLSGDLIPARAEAQRLHTVAKESNIVYTEIWSRYMAACTYLHANDLDRAIKHFTKVVQQRYILHARAAVDAVAGLALSQQMAGQTEAATVAIEMLQVFALELKEAQYLSVAQSCRARIALLRGDLEWALPWAHSLDEPPACAGLFMWLEVPVLTQARVLIAEASPTSLAKAADLLTEIYRQAEQYRFVNQVIECVLLQAVVFDKMGRDDEALTAFNQAIAFAAPRGWVRPFVEAGLPIANLLNRLPAQATAGEFIQRLQASCEHGELAGGDKGCRQPMVPPHPTPLSTPPPQPLIEPLTNRELDVLEMLSDRLQNKEIAVKLCVSPATVKSHLRSIYQKLAVSKRREAVEKAAILGIFNKH